MYLYLVVLLLTFSIPLIMSFEKKLQFFKQFKYLFPSITIVAVYYLIFDILYTKIGIWGFNSQYHLNIKIFDLPFEEILFFFIIPYTCIFLHDTIHHYLLNLNLSKTLTNIISIIIFSVVSIILFENYNKYYTLFAGIMMLLALSVSYFDKSNILSKFYFTFIFILLPFLVVNGILTGSFLNSQIVWYNDNHNLGIRILTIPIEDFFYGFTLIYFVLFFRELFKRKYDIKITIFNRK